MKIRETGDPWQKSYREDSRDYLIHYEYNKLSLNLINPEIAKIV
jgi:hypothetical protein